MNSNYADNIVNIGKMVINFNVYTVKIVLVGSSNIVIKNDSLVPKEKKVGGNARRTRRFLSGYAFCLGTRLSRLVELSN